MKAEHHCVNISPDLALNLFPLFLRMSFDKLKKDIHLWKEELRSKTEARPQKEWKLSSLRHDLEQMKYTMDSYKVGP